MKTLGSEPPMAVAKGLSDRSFVQMGTDWAPAPRERPKARVRNLSLVANGIFDCTFSFRVTPPPARQPL